MAVVSERIQIYRAGAGRIGSSALFLGLVLAAPALLGLGRLLPDERAGARAPARRGFRCVLLVPGGIFVRAIGRPAHVRRHDRGVVRVEPRRARRGSRAHLRDRRDDRDDALAARRVRGRLPRAGPPARAGGLRAERAQDARRRRRGGLALRRSRLVDGEHDLRATASSTSAACEARGVRPDVAQRRQRVPGRRASPRLRVSRLAFGLRAHRRLADVDPATALLHLPAILTPLAVVLAYAAGAALFRSPGAGVATAAAQVGLLGFSRSGTGSFDFMAQPATVSRALIAPALLALVFSFVGGGRRRQVLSIAAASLALALVHPTYAFFVAVPLVGFLIARAILATRRWRELSGWRRRSRRCSSRRACSRSG